MRFSIITPSFNSARFIEATIASIESQDYPDVEHIVMDGGSTDGTADILRRHSRIQWVSEKDEGQSDALNKGFARCTGEILAWQNADDLYAPGAFRAVADFFRDNPFIDLVYGYYQNIAEDGSWICDVRPREWNLWQFAHGRFVPMQPTVFWRRRVHKTVGPLDRDLHYCMDVDFFARAAKIFRFARIPKLLGQFRFHDASKTQNWFNKRKVRDEYRAVLARQFNYGPIDHILFTWFEARGRLASQVKQRWLRGA